MLKFSNKRDVHICELQRNWRKQSYRTHLSILKERSSGMKPSYLAPSSSKVCTMIMRRLGVMALGLPKWLTYYLMEII